MSTRLLISVRNASEARLAAAAGVDIIDLKEPNHGSLGPATVAVAHEVAQTVQRQTPMSVAMGELFEEANQPSISRMLRSDSLAKFSFAKVGLSGALRTRDWKSRWRNWRRDLPDATQPVLVHYPELIADAPRLDDVLELAMASRVSLILCDTFEKNGQDLFSHFSASELEGLIQTAHANCIQIALAGSLRGESLKKAIEIRPSIVAVRSAACVGGRRSNLCASRVAELKKILGEFSTVDKKSFSLSDSEFASCRRI